MRKHECNVSGGLSLPGGVVQVVFMLGALSCANEEDHARGEAVVGQQGALFAETGTVLWNGASAANQGPLGTSAQIPVCFSVRPRIATNNIVECPSQTNQNLDCEGRSTNPFNSEVLNQPLLRTMIRGAVERSWASSANVEFIGWGDCQIDAATNMHLDSQLTQTIVIQFQQEFPPPPNQACQTNADCSATPHAECKNQICVSGGVDWASVLGKSTNVPTVIQFNWPPMQAGMNVFNLIHEFGHALGFAHEWRRGDFNEPDCNFSDEGAVSNRLDFTLFPDRNSIMNYCGTSNPGMLSAGDVLGMRRAYGKKYDRALVGDRGMCADIANGSTAIGTGLLVFPCFNSWNQRWARASTSEYFRASVPTGGTRCIDGTGGAVTSQLCDSATVNQTIRLNNVELRAMGNMCLEAMGVNGRIEARICDGSIAQKWSLFEGDTATSQRPDQIKSVSTGQCVTSSSGALGEELVLANCSQYASEQGFTYPGQGIIMRGSLCLNVLGGSPTPGGRLGLWNGCTATPRPYNAQFSASGTMQINGQCLDIWGGNSNPNDPIGLFPCHGGPNQIWEYNF